MTNTITVGQWYDNNKQVIAATRQRDPHLFTVLCFFDKGDTAEHVVWTYNAHNGEFYDGQHFPAERDALAYYIIKSTEQLGCPLLMQLGCMEPGLRKHQPDAQLMFIAQNS